MDYIQLSIELTEPDQDVVIALLSSQAAIGFEQSDTHLLAYFEEDSFQSYDVHEVLKKFRFAITTIKDKNWNAAWEESFQPVTVDHFCAVRAQFHKPILDVLHQIVITPKMSFGTGHHATTYMMMQQMQAMDFRNKNVLDFGTGTGILAILAEILGAGSVTAIDNDIWSFENVQENIRINNCNRIIALLTDVVPQEQMFDVILANITKNVLLQYMGILKSCIKPAGYIAMSGLLLADKNEITDTCSKQGMNLVKEISRDGWISLLFVN